MEPPVREPSLSVGLRVVRGPDWAWGQQDGGEGNVGTVVELGEALAAPTAAAAATTPTPEKTVVVQWDSGARTNYRAGHQGGFDLRVLDNAPAGVRHAGDVLCAGCGRSAFFGIRWHCADCRAGPDEAEVGGGGGGGGGGVGQDGDVVRIDLCNRCYGADKHDVSHRFVRFERPSSASTPTSQCYVAPPRRQSRRASIRGIFPGARVRRSLDWVWKDQDGGAGAVGEAVSLEGWEGETDRSVVRVRWPKSTACNLYRLGHRGKVDVQLAKRGVGQSSPDGGGGGGGVIGGFYYPEHLPVLGKSELAGEATREQRHSREHTLSKFSVGDAVMIAVAVDVLRLLQEGHGGFHARMASLIGVVGRVHRVTEAGDIRVQFDGKPDNQHRWTLHPAALTKVPSAGTSLRTSHPEQIRQLKQDQVITPSARGVQALVVQTAAKGDVRGIEALLKTHPTVDPSAVCKSLLVAAKYARLEVIQLLANRFPGEVNRRGGASGKTPLHVAVYHGQLDAADLLLSCGAQIESRDDEGDGPLHYAAYAGQATVAQFLLERGASCNAANGAKRTPLHVAVGRRDEGTVAALLEGGCDPNCGDANGNTAAHEAAVKNARRALVEQLLAGGATFERVNKRGFNAAHLAALKGNDAALASIVRVCPDLRATAKADGMTPLHIACLNGRVNCVKALLALQDSNLSCARDRTGRTPLHHACARGFFAVAEMLLHNGDGADAACPDSEGVTPLHLALDTAWTEEGQEQQQVTLEAAKIDPSVLNEVTRAGVPTADRCRAALATLLVVNGGDARHLDAAGRSPFDLLSHPQTRAYLLNAMLLHRAKSPVGEARGQATDAVPAIPSASSSRLLSEREECRVCSEVNLLVLFEPCGHKVACTDCAVRMKKCLDCKQEIAEKRTAEAGDQLSLESTKVEQVRGPPKSKGDKGKMQELEAKVRDLEEGNLCLICMERQRNLAFLCGHQACSECGESITICHMCRVPVGKKIHLF